MSIGKVSFKASGPSTDEALGLKQKVEEALSQIEEAEKFDQYYSADEKAKLELKKAELMADLQSLEYFLKTGEWIGATAAAAAALPFADLSDITEGGWYVWEDGAAVPAEISSDGTVMVPAQADGNPTPLTLIMTSSTDPSKDMMSVEFENKGKDVVATITYADDPNHKETFLIKGAAQIGVNALKSEHAVKVDASKAIVTDKNGDAIGFFIIGTKYDGDMLIGSAGGGDNISGAGGSDYLSGAGGANDEVYGYVGEAYDANGAKVSLESIYGAEMLGEDGNDKIVDVDGEDYVHAGDGANDTVIRGGDPLSPDLTAENEIPLKPSDPQAIANWFSVSGTVNSNGELEIDADSAENKNIKLEVKEGYMASAEKDNNDLLLTFVKETSAGEEPEYYTVRISNYFNQNDVTLDITGAFIDMHEVYVGFNTVNIHGTNNDGDILMGPMTKFDELGMTAEDLGTSTFSKSEVEQKLSALQSDGDDDAKQIWDPAEVNEAGEIEFKEGEISEEDLLDIPGTLGAVAFVQNDGNDKLITVVSTDGNDSNRIVIRIINGANKDFDIQVNLMKDGYVFDLGDAFGGVTIDGGAGNDLAIGYEYGTKVTDPEGIELKVKKLNADYETGEGPTIKTVTDYKAMIQDDETDLDKLDALKEDVKDKFDGDNETELLEEIAEKRADLLTAEIAKLGTLKTAVDTAADETKKAAAQKALDDAKTKIEAQLAKLKEESDDNTNLPDLDSDIYNDAQKEYDDKLNDLAAS